MARPKDHKPAMRAVKKATAIIRRQQLRNIIMRDLLEIKQIQEQLWRCFIELEEYGRE